MNNEEFAVLLKTIFPLVVKGLIRPNDPIPTDLPFSTDFPQFIRTDPVLYNQENAMMRRTMSNDRVMSTSIKAIQAQLADCDLRIVTELVKGLMHPNMLIKLNGIQSGALNNPHPATHPASIITQDAARRMVSDAQISTWNGKASGSHGNHVPTTQTANSAVFLRNDNTWQAVTPSNIGAYAKAETYTKTEANNLLNAKANTNHGNHVPTVQGANNSTFLRNDNTWQAVTPSNIGAYMKAETYTKTEANNLLNAKANLSSPALTGTPTAPTPATADNSTKIATTAFVKGITSNITAKNSVVVLTGVIGNGGTIPLPASFTQDQCSWMIGLNRIYQGSGGESLSWVNADRTVHFGGNVTPQQCMYIIVGVK